MEAQSRGFVLSQGMDSDVPGRTFLLNFSREQEDGLLRHAAIVKVEIHLSHDETVIDCAVMICDLAYREKKWVATAIERWIGLSEGSSLQPCFFPITNTLARSPFTNLLSVPSRTLSP